MKNAKHFIAVVVKYMCATTTKGTRIRIKLPRFNKTIRIPYNYDFDNVRDQAAKHLEENGVPIAGYCSNQDEDILLVDFKYVDCLDRIFENNGAALQVKS